MFDKRERTTYYVSDLGTGRVSIIDGESYRIIKEIEIGLVPRNIYVDEKNNVYIASDRSNKVTLINDLYDAVKTWHMPNNGNIQVDYLRQRIYVCNTEEVCIYSLDSGEKFGTITGFSAADCLRLDMEKNRLYVLDILLNEIKVYDTTDYHLIKIYKGVGKGPSCMLIGEDGKCVYIANKGIYKGNNTGNISILDMQSSNISYIDMQVGSVITALEQSGKLLYAVNSGLNRIDVIDTKTRECLSIIRTTLPEIQRIRLTKEGRLLLVTSRNNDGKGVIDRIDTSSYMILDTLIFNQNNSFPYDIGVVSESAPKLEVDAFILSNSEDKMRGKNETAILAKKIISTYQEKVNFPEVITNVPLKDQETLGIERVVFEQCKIKADTKSRKIIENRSEYSILEYNYFIPYYIELRDEYEHKYIIEGRLEGIQKASIYIPAYAEQQGVEFVINSSTNLTSHPMVIENKLKFGASVLISTKVIVEEIVYIPICKECKWWQTSGQREEGENG